MKIGIIREGKVPNDARVPIIPTQCKKLIEQYNLDLVVQPSPTRCYTDDEFVQAGVTVQEDLTDRDILLGVKEVPIDQLIAGKQYLFFSHTHKKQVYNRKLLKAFLEKNIHMVDYELLTNTKNQRLIAFGVFAGMVGAHNALYTYGKRTGQLNLKRLKDCHDYAEAISIYKKTQFPKVKIVLTGSGRVSSGAVKVLQDMGIKKVIPFDFLTKEYDEAVFTQLDCQHYVTHKNGQPYMNQDFYSKPEAFESKFQPYTEVADIMINGIFWDNKAPAFFTKEEMKSDKFNIKVIADVTCDIAPISSIPSTLKASTIANPIFGYDPQTEKEVDPHGANVIDMMTIDNLPNELPRDASESFGNQFSEYIIKELLMRDSDVIERASITRNGALTNGFEYLRDFVAS